jgi:hypothetical protein
MRTNCRTVLPWCRVPLRTPIPLDAVADGVQVGHREVPFEIQSGQQESDQVHRAQRNGTSAGPIEAMTRREVSARGESDETSIPRATETASRCNQSAHRNQPGKVYVEAPVHYRPSCRAHCESGKNAAVQRIKELHHGSTGNGTHPSRNMRGKRVRGAGWVIPKHFRAALTQRKGENELGWWSGGLRL